MRGDEKHIVYDSENFVHLQIDPGEIDALVPGDFCVHLPGTTESPQNCRLLLYLPDVLKFESRNKR